MTQRIPPDKHPTNHHGYEYQQGSLWGDQETKAIQQETVRSKLRQTLADGKGTYRLTMGVNALEHWKQGVLNHQLRIRTAIRSQVDGGSRYGQGVLLDQDASAEGLGIEGLGLNGVENQVADGTENCTGKPLLDPFDLPVYPAEFYRLPQGASPNLGGNDACIYFVIDQAAQLLLYVGETCRSQKRWQGNHDCKRYIQNYQGLHYQHQKNVAVVMAFAWDVPQSSRQRQHLEQQLIQLWRSPFNRENWQYWQTPFGNSI